MFFVLFCTNLSYSQIDNERTLDAVFNHWMMLNCGTADKIDWKLEIGQYAEQIEPLFLEAFKNGPDSKRLAESSKASQLRFQMTQEYMSSENNILSDEDIERYKNLKAEEYVELENKDFIFSYKSNALSGLGLIKSKSAIDFLKRIVDNSESPFQAIAALAL